MSDEDLIKDDPFDWIDEMAADATAVEDAAMVGTSAAEGGEEGPSPADAEEPPPSGGAVDGTAEEAVGGIYASTPVRLPAHLTREAAHELKGHLATMLAEEEIILLEGEGVSLCDTAGLQLLAAFFKTAERDNVFAGWHGVSVTLREYARTLGLESILALEEA